MTAVTYHGTDQTDFARFDIARAGMFNIGLKFGKLHHNKAVEQSVDGPKFRDEATALLEHYCCEYYRKEDLRKAS